MEIPLRKEIFNILKDKNIDFLAGNHPVWNKLINNTAKFRDHLLTIEPSSRPSLSKNPFWEITSKYRFDILRKDIKEIANALAVSIGLSTLYYPQVTKRTDIHAPTMADRFFWYHVDYGIRLISSGWDRIALMLDSAFDLNTKTKCSLPLVLSKISNHDNLMVNQVDFKCLRRFCDTDFKDLQAGPGKGFRHETTHLFLTYTRIYFEFLESHSTKQVEVPPDLRPKERLDFLTNHHKFYLFGILKSSRLVSFKWPK
ncbi:hypothetical protein MYX76_14385 [Desulfobacterota bacterium AH_259_B03_O07]|nr:hypothetical protein [Desulfobacterota bacterium AH_259_B03_O07]